MVDKVDAAFLAEKVIEKYSNDLNLLTDEECADLGIPTSQCHALRKVLGWGRNGAITSQERKTLEQAGFAKEFIEKLAGTDGKKALRARVKMLANHPADAHWEIRDVDFWSAIPALNKALRDGDPKTRCNAVTALGFITYEINRDPSAKGAVHYLIVALGDEVSYVRRGAAIYLKMMGPDAKDAVPFLTVALKDNNSSVRREVARALAKIGPAAGSSIGALEDMAQNDPLGALRVEADDALKKIRGQ